MSAGLFLEPDQEISFYVSRGESGRRTALTHPLGLTTVAFVVTAIPSFLLTKVIGKHLEKF